MEERKPGGGGGGGVNPQSCHPRHWLVPVLLLTLRDGPSYGYEMLEQMAKRFGMEAANPGTIYRALRQMERDGMLKSSWEASTGGPARRVYALTELGERELDLWAQALNESQSRIDDFLKLYHQKEPRAAG